MSSFVRFCPVLALFFACAQPEPLPEYGQTPAFELTERSGRTVSSSELAGKVWVADFIFTTCAGPCPLMSTHMASLQRALDGRDVELVSFTVDPERDTPEVLSAYAKRYKADPERWLFLTGEKQALYDMIKKGFLLAVDDGSLTQGDTPGPGIVTHSVKFVLVDQQGLIRGYYSGEEAGVVDAILPDIDRLLAEAR
ncbi:MAG: SCO family protein [Acidobacteria bacterium]|nr:SCO family protein [Acidobacteriota bacterium]